MGKPTRRRPPLSNDLLYACPVGMSWRAIAAALDASDYWVAEVSARDWTDATQDEIAFWQVARALGYRDWSAIRPGTIPEALGPLGYPGKGVPGIVAPLDTTRRSESVVDELIVIRDSRAAPTSLLAKLLDRLLGPGTERPSMYSRARRHDVPGWLLALEGWQEPTLDAHGLGHHVNMVVNQLPPAGADDGTTS
ncbi:MAG TPA: hypothetical protein VFU60_10510 [Ktedonobacterales bacterium]|nr:hypothetical protein [Ktedonobacterales bacterium]